MSLPELDLTRVPRHIAIIMDGNGRWARRRSLPRIEGHRQGDTSVEEVIRVVRVRKGSFKAAEFQLRPGETGLSVFAASRNLSSERLLQAVRDAGKQGELAVALVPVRIVRELGLILVRTPGGIKIATKVYEHRAIERNVFDKLN